MHSLVATLGIELEIAELVRVLVGSDDAEVITELLLLHVLLGKVLEVTLAEVDLGLDDDTVLVLRDADGVGEVASLAINLDLLLEEIREIVEHDNIIGDGELAVDDILGDRLLALGSLAALLLHSLAHVG